MPTLTRMPYWRSDHLDFREEVRGFVDLHARLLWQETDDGSERFPWGVRKAAAEASLAAIDLPQQWGGRGLDLVSQGIAYEESGRLDVNAREMLGSGHARLLERFGTQQVQQDWLPRVVQGDALVGVGVTEAAAGSDIRGIQTSATRHADGAFSLTGSKTLISRIHEAQAFVVFGKTQHDREQHTLSAFLVDMSSPGITRSEIGTMGMRGWSYGTISFDSVPVPAHNLLGKEGAGYPVFEDHFACWRVLMALVCLGAADQSIEETIAYANTRRVFGGMLSTYSSVMSAIAEHATQVGAARLLCYQALWMGDQGARFVTESAMAKWLGTTTAFNAVNAMLQIFGARGYTHQYPLEKRLRDIRGLMIADGATDIMKLLVGREIVGNEPYNHLLGRGGTPPLAY